MSGVSSISRDKEVIPNVEIGDPVTSAQLMSIANEALRFSGWKALRAVHCSADFTNGTNDILSPLDYAPDSPESAPIITYMPSPWANYLALFVVYQCWGPIDETQLITYVAQVVDDGVSEIVDGIKWSLERGTLKALRDESPTYTYLEAIQTTGLTPRGGPGVDPVSAPEEGFLRPLSLKNWDRDNPYIEIQMYASYCRVLSVDVIEIYEPTRTV